MAHYAGSCQCGNVRFEADTEIKEVISCNCSRCSRLGSLLAAVPRVKFKIVSDKGATIYKFNKHVIDHVFCSTCGIQPYATGKGPGGVEMAMINVRCVEGVDPESFKVMKFDGRSM
ncbi:MAG: GFA family protein [Pseudolabrys sp.]|nr:GFA family protein [Pseudolabrys sp.]MBV9260783.1 GFA family protein [Pseudolabrys sp.]